MSCSDDDAIARRALLALALGLAAWFAVATNAVAQALPPTTPQPGCSTSARIRAPRCRDLHVAYTLKGAKPRDAAVTFLFNAGRGRPASTCTCPPSDRRRLRRRATAAFRRPRRACRRTRTAGSASPTSCSSTRSAPATADAARARRQAPRREAPTTGRWRPGRHRRLHPPMADGQQPLRARQRPSPGELRRATGRGADAHPGRAIRHQT